MGEGRPEASLDDNMMVDAEVNDLEKPALKDVAMQEGSASINFLIKELLAHVKQGPVITNTGKSKLNIGTKASFAEVVKGAQPSSTTRGLSTQHNHGFFDNPAQRNVAKGESVKISLMSQDIEMLKKKREILDQELQEITRQLKLGIAGMKRSLSETEYVDGSDANLMDRMYSELMATLPQQ
ncbi:hypothetical protein L7F22_067322, partial [Adiantum nelumboides]|nr:hypothetical protein [Adiantum nelumboides]